MSPILSPPSPALWGSSLGPRRSSSGSSSSGYHGNVYASNANGAQPMDHPYAYLGHPTNGANSGQFLSPAIGQLGMSGTAQPSSQLLSDYNYTSNVFRSEGSLGPSPPSQDSCNVWLPLSDGVLETVCARATAITGAIWAADIRRVRALLDPISSHLRTLVTSHRCPDTPDPPLLTACRLGTVAMAQFLLEECGANVNENTDAVTALHMAIFNGEEAMVQLLLQYGANPSVMCADGTPLLLMAAARGDFYVCELLVQKMFTENTLGIQTQINLLELSGTFLVDIGMQEDGHFRKGIDHFLTAMDMRYDEHGSLKILKRGWSRNSGATFKAVAALAKESQTMEEMEAATSSRHEMRMESVLALKRILYNSAAAFIGLVKRAFYFASSLPNYYECSFFLLRAGEQLKDAVDYSPNFDTMAALCVPVFPLVIQCMQFMFNMEATWQALQTMYHTQIIHRYSRSQLAVRLADLFLRASAAYISRIRPPSGLNPRHLAPEWQAFCFDVFRIVEVIQMNEDEKCKLNKARHELLIRISSAQVRDAAKPPLGNTPPSLAPTALGGEARWANGRPPRTRVRSGSSHRMYPRKPSSSGRLPSSGSSDGGASSVDTASSTASWPTAPVSVPALEVAGLSQTFAHGSVYPSEVAILPQRVHSSSPFPSEAPVLAHSLPNINNSNSNNNSCTWTTMTETVATTKANFGHTLLEAKTAGVWAPMGGGETTPQVSVWTWPAAQGEPQDKATPHAVSKTTTYGAAHPIGGGKTALGQTDVDEGTARLEMALDAVCFEKGPPAHAGLRTPPGQSSPCPTGYATALAAVNDPQGERTPCLPGFSKDGPVKMDSTTEPVVQDITDSDSSPGRDSVDLESLPAAVGDPSFPSKHLQVIRLREMQHMTYRMRAM